MAALNNCLSFCIKALSRAFLCVLLAVAVTILFSTPTSGISQEQREAISQNCTTIKQTLGQLQRVDSRVRTYLGTTYETISSRFMIPLNIRLIKNNRAGFSNLQSDFNSEQLRFRSMYTDYMRELETLVGINCQVSPDDFYKQLEVVRSKREELRSTTEKLTRIANEQYLAVKLLKDNL